MALRNPSQISYQPALPKIRLSLARVNVTPGYTSQIYAGVHAAVGALAGVLSDLSIVSFRIDVVQGPCLAQGSRHLFQGAVLPFNVCGSDGGVVALLKQNPTLAV